MNPAIGAIMSLTLLLAGVSLCHADEVPPIAGTWLSGDGDGWIDLVVVPGLAFDAGGGRLGFGAGYYDRFLAEVSAPKVGLVYRALLLDEVPQEDHDIAMDIVITEEQTIFCKESFP